MTEDYVFIQSVLRAAINDAYRLGIGAAIQTIEKYRGQSVDVETLDKISDDLRRQSAGAENP